MRYTIKMLEYPVFCMIKPTIKYRFLGTYFNPEVLTQAKVELKHKGNMIEVGEEQIKGNFSPRRTEENDNLREECSLLWKMYSMSAYHCKSSKTRGCFFV